MMRLGQRLGERRLGQQEWDLGHLGISLYNLLAPSEPAWAQACICQKTSSSLWSSGHMVAC